MPARNRLKEYEAGAYYHVYNRGVNKNIIFNESQDYSVFLSYLKSYLIPKDINGLNNILVNPLSTSSEKDSAIKMLRMNNFYESIKLVSFVLMPNHFHFHLWQKEENSMDKFMNSLFTRFSMFINKKYKRIGPVFQSVYKAVKVISEEQSNYLTRYIHRNPIKLDLASPPAGGLALRSYEYSSYPCYLGFKKIEWVDKEIILNNFTKSGVNSYRNFVEDEDEEEKSSFILNNYCLD